VAKTAVRRIGEAMRTSTKSIRKASGWQVCRRGGEQEWTVDLNLAPMLNLKEEVIQ